MLIDYLKKELQQRQQKNASYSIRAFAKSLNVDASVFSKILAGSRALSYPLAKKITEGLKLDDSVKNILLLTYADTERKFFIESDFFIPDESMSSELMSKWEYFATLSYLEINNHFDIEKIANFLKTSENTVSIIIENLIKLNIVELQQDKFILTGKKLTAPKTFNSNL